MKIFLTVGSMLPFDRLVRAADIWAKDHLEYEIFAQIGDTHHEPKNFKFKHMVAPSEFRKYCSGCDLIISHVGMGTVITALECAKPLVALPRMAELNEATSNHQVATAQWLRNRPGIRIIHSEADLDSAISDLVVEDSIEIMNSGTQDLLIKSVRNFIFDGNGNS